MRLKLSLQIVTKLGKERLTVALPLSDDRQWRGEISKNSGHPIDRDIFLQPCIFDNLTIADAKPRYLTNRMDQKVSKCTKWGIFPRDHTIPRRRPHFDNLLLHFTTVNVS